MSEYIKRQDAIDAIKSVPTGNWSSKRYAGKIEKIPPADVKPVVRGKWIPVNFGDMRCSICGGVYGVCGGLLGDYNFCPNCSADMRELEQN